MIIAILVGAAFLIAIAGGILTALTDARAAAAANDRQIGQMMGVIGNPPTTIEQRPGDRPRQPGNPALEEWYAEYHARYPKADPYPAGAMQAPVAIPNFTA